jgi:hypothetical protein
LCADASCQWLCFVFRIEGVLKLLFELVISRPIFVLVILGGM